MDRSPGNAAYHALWADYVESLGESPDAELELATRLDPFESQFWLRRAFRAEVEQKFDEAERFLKTAARTDHGYDPVWALTNYYFRRGDPEKFWHYATVAFAKSYGDPVALFRLCAAVDPDPARVRGAIPPAREDLLIAYFRNLLREQPATAYLIAPDAALHAGDGEVREFVAFVNSNRKVNGKAALAVWNTLCSRHLLPFSPLAPAEGSIVTNGDFTIDFSETPGAFDWVFDNSPAVRGSRLPEGGLQLDFAGIQADSPQILTQILPSISGNPYVVAADYTVTAADSPLGLYLTVRDPDSSYASAPLAEVPLRSMDTSVSVAFTPHNLSSVLLSLEYRRALGSTSWKGQLLIHHVRSGLVARPGKAAH